MVVSIPVSQMMARLGLGLAMASMALPAAARIETGVSPGRSASVAALASADQLASGSATVDAEADAELDEPIQPRPNADAAPIPLIPMAHGDQFRVGFPPTWVVTHADTDPLLTATAPTGEPAITTEVSWYAEAPGQIVPLLLADIREKNHTVARYDAVSVDGTTALRLWLTDLPDSEPPYAFITVVGYSDATAILVSRYATRSDDLDNLLNQIHQSFRRGESTAAPDTHHP